MAIILVAIGGYWWLEMLLYCGYVLMVIGEYFIVDIGGY